MALVFELAAECGGKQEDAEAFAQHFAGFESRLSDGVTSRCAVKLSIDVEQNWWCFVYPSGVSRSGIVTEEDARRMTELGNILYNRMMSAPPFRYAQVGIEVEEFSTIRELLEPDGELNLPDDGVVLSREVWESMGRPLGFSQFRPGYCWRPYLGEKK